VLGGGGFSEKASFVVPLFRLCHTSYSCHEEEKQYHANNADSKEKQLCAHGFDIRGLSESKESEW